MEVALDMHEKATHVNTTKTKPVQPWLLHCRLDELPQLQRVASF